MANEITIAMSLLASKGGASVNSVGSTGPASASYDMTGTNMYSGTQVFGTSDTALDVGAVTAPYRAYICNLDAANDLHIDRSSTVSATPFTVLEPGDECFIVVPSGTTIYAKGTASNTDVFVVAVEK